jgi:hypothetical protein
MPSLSTAKVRLTIQSLLTNARDLSTPTDKLLKVIENAFSNGTGANQANEVWHDQRSLATGANEDLDLAGALTGVLGGTLTFAAIKAIIFAAAAQNTTNLTVSRPASNGVPFLAAASDAFVLTPGGLFVLTNPSAGGILVTADTGDLINVANAAGATATYDVVIIGEV